MHPANVQDRDGALLLLKETLKDSLPKLEVVIADGAYQGKLVDKLKEQLGLRLDIVKRSDDMEGFVVLPQRWIVERTFAWISRNRRMAKDYEALCESSESFMYICMIGLMLRRLGKANILHLIKKPKRQHAA